MKKDKHIVGFLCILICFIILFSFTCCSKKDDSTVEENRVVLVDTGVGTITFNAKLPDGYSFRNTNDPENYAETKKRKPNEKVGEYEIVKDGKVVVYIYNRPEGELDSRKESLETQKAQIIPDGPGPKGIEFLDEGTDINGNRYLFYEFQYRDDTTAYIYVVDFPNGSKSSLELSTLDSREDAENFFKLLNFKFEFKK